MESGGEREPGENKTEKRRAPFDRARYRQLQFRQRKGCKYFKILFCPRMIFFSFIKWFIRDKGSHSRQQERTLAVGQGDGWTGDIQLGRTGCVFV